MTNKDIFSDLIAESPEQAETRRRASDCYKRPTRRLQIAKHDEHARRKDARPA